MFSCGDRFLDEFLFIYFLYFKLILKHRTIHLLNFTVIKLESDLTSILCARASYVSYKCHIIFRAVLCDVQYF